MLASAFIVTACDPIEDEDLRDKYVTDAGTPITKEALQAAISITQPFPNQDGVVEGDQYIALKNSRPDIGVRSTTDNALACERHGLRDRCDGLRGKRVDL